MIAPEQIRYSLDSGAVLPDHQAHAEYLITPDEITLTRRGFTTGTQVNEGMWRYPVDKKVAQELFSLAAEKRCADYERQESADPPDGAGTETITLIYKDGESCSLYFDPGTTYKGAEVLLERIRALIQTLDESFAFIVP